MRVVERKIAETRRENRRMASFALNVSEQCRRAILPELIDIEQMRLRVALREAEVAIAACKSRNKRTRLAINRYRRRFGNAPLIGQHLRARDALMQHLHARRFLLRSLGDTIAWIILRSDARLIRPLYAERPQYLTLGTGLVGAVAAMQRAHETGDFLVVDNDLTRCLGIGDITVVPTKFAWRHPLSIELKSSAVPGIAAVDVDMLTTVSSDPMHTQLHEAFVHALNLNEGALRQLDIRGVKQKDEMLRRGELLARVFNVPRNVVSTHQSTWKSLRNVLDRTLQFGSALDVPEPGVAYIAICCWDNDAGVKDLAQLTELLRDVGIPKGEPSLTVEDFRTMESLSSVVAPIYLWSLPSHQRIALLIGDVFLGVVFAESVWRDAFAKEGMVLHENNSEWQISGNHVDFSFDRFEVLKLKAGVAFGGISPRAVAREIADMETRQHAD